jgi:heme exporter protein A
MRLVVENLSVARGDNVVFSDLSFEVGTGEALVVTGPNGSGKSTLLKTVAGFLRPVAGTLRFTETGDADIDGLCHYLGHANALKPSLTVRENLAFWRDFLGNPLASVEAALDSVGLRATVDLPAGYLSAGQKRRIAIARLLVSYRPVWLIDEPTAALDTAAEQRFAELLQTHLDTGGIVLAATHQELAIAGPRRLDLQRQGERAT